MRVSLVERPQWAYRYWLRSTELKQLEIAGTGPEHASARSGARNVQDLVEHRFVVPTELISNDLKTECLFIEINHAGEIVDVNRHVMDSSYHW
jgi:hypothetical protein